MEIYMDMDLRTVRRQMKMPERQRQLISTAAYVWRIAKSDLESLILDRGREEYFPGARSAQETAERSQGPCRSL